MSLVLARKLYSGYSASLLCRRSLPVAIEFGQSKLTGNTTSQTIWCQCKSTSASTTGNANANEEKKEEGKGTTSQEVYKNENWRRSRGGVQNGSKRTDQQRLRRVLRESTAPRSKKKATNIDELFQEVQPVIKTEGSLKAAAVKAENYLVQEAIPGASTEGEDVLRSKSESAQTKGSDKEIVGPSEQHPADRNTEKESAQRLRDLAFSSRPKLKQRGRRQTIPEPKYVQISDTLKEMSPVKSVEQAETTEEDTSPTRQQTGASTESEHPLRSKSESEQPKKNDREIECPSEQHPADRNTERESAQRLRDLAFSSRPKLKQKGRRQRIPEPKYVQISDTLKEMSPVKSGEQAETAEEDTSPTRQLTPTSDRSQLVSHEQAEAQDEAKAKRVLSESGDFSVDNERDVTEPPLDLALLRKKSIRAAESSGDLVFADVQQDSSVKEKESTSEDRKMSILDKLIANQTVAEEGDVEDDINKPKTRMLEKFVLSSSDETITSLRDIEGKAKATLMPSTTDGDSPFTLAVSDFFKADDLQGKAVEMDSNAEPESTKESSNFLDQLISDQMSSSVDTEEVESVGEGDAQRLEIDDSGLHEMIAIASAERESAYTRGGIVRTNRQRPPKVGELFTGTRLGIFNDKASGGEIEKQFVSCHENEYLNILNAPEMTREPRNGFEEQLQVADKVWQLPVDNEITKFEEEHVGFEEHVFLDYLLDEFPSVPSVQRFMELVINGLQQNPYLSVEQKKAKVYWFKDYFSNFSEEDLQVKVMEALG